MSFIAYCFVTLVGARMETVLSFEAFPSTALTLLFFQDVCNSAAIKQQIVDKALPYDAAFLDADVLPGILLTHLASFKALAAQVRQLQQLAQRRQVSRRACHAKQVYMHMTCSRSMKSFIQHASTVCSMTTAGGAHHTLQLAQRQLCLVQKAGALLSHSLHADIVVNHSGTRHIANALKTFGIGASTTRLLVAVIDAAPEQLQQIRDTVQGQQQPVPDGPMGDEKKMRKAFKVDQHELQVGTVLDAALCKSALQDS